MRVLLAVVMLLACLPQATAAQTACRFQLGFKLIADQIPDLVGQCLEDERFNVANGNAEQRTTAHHGQGGLLVWRKADNWSAFTDGHCTWVNGPFGLQQRLNTERFAWEREPVAAAETPAQTPAVPAPMLDCQKAIELVKLHHQFLLPTMARVVGDISFNCVDSTADGGRVVRLSWVWEGRTRVATYAVGPSGQVAPFDGNAAKIDTAARGISVAAFIVLLRTLL